MPYNYLNASLSITGKSPKDSFIEHFQHSLNLDFANATDYHVIEEETTFASGEYQEIGVRVLTHIVTSETGEKNGDDYKKILFQDITHATQPGWMYRFDDNYWVVSQADIIKNLAASCVVRRCNNVFRWIDLNGGYHEAPVAINEIIKENRDYSTAGSSLVIPAAQLECLLQLNSYTNLIEPNQRFLIGNTGNWHSYKVLGGGVNNYNLLKTFDNTSAGLLRLSLGANYVNKDTDDLVNGIADVYQNVYTLSLSDTVLSGSVGNTRQLTSIITYNGVSVSRSVVWSSSNVLVSTVSNAGLVTFIGNGTATISATLVDNIAVSASASVTVSATPTDDYIVIVSPTTNYILEGDTKDYTCYLYKNGVQQADVFTFTFNSNGATADNYHYSILGDNSFRIISSKMYLASPITIDCVSGLYSKTVSINLRGAY